jgi:hypothetical protein
MRVLLNARIPHQPFNVAAQDDTAGLELKRILDALKPEAAYFTEHGGQPDAVILVDLPDASKIPVLADLGSSPSKPTWSSGPP